ncbi:MAG: HAD-IA family hydrolase [Gammaproteobacteria bacterium]|jgi:phosphoglycolate phosphatase|nr:HAD-IA family hydrolase [Gammaproteobacteria bacterium]
MIRSVLFDLDGTLADTAPDLANALNNALVANGRSPLPLQSIRYQVSNGASALVKLGFNIDSGHAEFEPLRLQLLDFYAQAVATDTRLFEGMHEVLNTLEALNIAWGVVTNKPTRFTKPLLHALELSQRSACIICGDTLEKKKPHPEPILHACSIVGCQPNETIYVGDAQRDIEAGRRAGTKTLVAMFGYIDKNQRPRQWGADGYIDTPQDIIRWLNDFMPN